MTVKSRSIVQLIMNNKSTDIVIKITMLRVIGGCDTAIGIMCIGGNTFVYNISLNLQHNENVNF